MQGVTAIRWSSSVLTAIALHTVCWFWADQILPPDIAVSHRPQRLAITLAANHNTSSIPTPVHQETLPQPSLPSVLPKAKSVEQEPVVQPTSNEALNSIKQLEAPKSAVAQAPMPALEPVQIKPKWKPKAPVRKKIVKALPPQKEEAQSIAAHESQPDQDKLANPGNFIKTSFYSTKKVLPTSLSAEETLSLKTPPPQRQAVASASPQAAPTFKNLPLVTQPAFSRPPTPPQYPKRAKRKRLQGQVILRARVDEQGLVEHIVIWQSSGHKLLDKAAEKAMWDWQFTPAKQAGIRTASWVEFPVNFAIR